MLSSPNMALQRTSPPSRSPGRPQRLLGSPLNTRPLGGKLDAKVRPFV
jgi:hypothetical protein